MRHTIDRILPVSWKTGTGILTVARTFPGIRVGGDWFICCSSNIQRNQETSSRVIVRKWMVLVSVFFWLELNFKRTHLNQCGISHCCVMHVRRWFVAILCTLTFPQADFVRWTFRFWMMGFSEYILMNFDGQKMHRLIRYMHVNYCDYEDFCSFFDFIFIFRHRCFGCELPTSWVFPGSPCALFPS